MVEGVRPCFSGVFVSHVYGFGGCLQTLSDKVSAICEHALEHAGEYVTALQQANSCWRTSIEATATAIKQFLTSLNHAE
jgi:hypothetical protein